MCRLLQGNLAGTARFQYIMVCITSGVLGLCGPKWLQIIIKLFPRGVISMGVRGGYDSANNQTQPI